VSQRPQGVAGMVNIQCSLPPDSNSRQNPHAPQSSPANPNHGRISAATRHRSNGQPHPAGDWLSGAPAPRAKSEKGYGWPTDATALDAAGGSPQKLIARSAPPSRRPKKNRRHIPSASIHRHIPQIVQHSLPSTNGCTAPLAFCSGSACQLEAVALY
jgi:hypothetical protein